MKNSKWKSVEQVEQAANQEMTWKKKRPERQLYVPPAQRKTNKIHHQSSSEHKSVEKQEVCNYIHNNNNSKVYNENGFERIKYVSTLDDLCDVATVTCPMVFKLDFSNIVTLLKGQRCPVRQAHSCILEKCVNLLNCHGDDDDDHNGFPSVTIKRIFSISKWERFTVCVLNCHRGGGGSKSLEHPQISCENVHFDMVSVELISTPFYQPHVSVLVPDAAAAVEAANNFQPPLKCCSENRSTSEAHVENVERKRTIAKAVNGVEQWQHQHQQQQQHHHHHHQHHMKPDEHEQEKEIMRKAKQHINRKSRPIMKYIDDCDRLDIGNTTNEEDLGDWEDLLNEDGHLEQMFLSQTMTDSGANKSVGVDVDAWRCKEHSGWSDEHDGGAGGGQSVCKDVDHMVELYGFPSSMRTCDLVAAFGELRSECMYIKWVDDTHALLVLGSAFEAQRALQVRHPLVKARPMTAASRSAKEKATKMDLRPALKRPETNLQTARRMITTHLGAKGKISREQTTKDREILQKAREKKRLARKNERDAWDGCLQTPTKEVSC